MALLPGQLDDALRAGKLPEGKSRASAEEVAHYEGEQAASRGRRGEIRRSSAQVDGRFPIAVVLGVFALQWQILLRLPS